MSDWQSGDLLVNGVRLRYHRSGGALPPVVLSHGLTDHGWYWAALARALAPRYDVVLYDSRGHGESDPSPGGYAVTQLAEDLVGVADALGLERPAAIGHSMGGVTVAVAAATHPGRFRRVVLEDPVWPDPAARPMDAAALIAGWRAQMLERKQTPRAELLAAQREAQPGWTDEDYELWADSKMAVIPEALEVMPTFARDWLDDARRIDCPLLVITGEPERGAIVGPASESALLRVRPDARVVRFSGTGHQPRRERFAEYRDAVLGFLAEG